MRFENITIIAVVTIKITIKTIADILAKLMPPLPSCAAKAKQGKIKDKTNEYKIKRILFMIPSLSTTKRLLYT